MSPLRPCFGLLLLVSALPARAQDAPIRVACIGDSITEGVGVWDRKRDAYPARLAGLLGDKWEVRNFGLSGATMLRTGDKPYDRQRVYQAALDARPDIAVIALGTNDSKPQNIENHPDDFIPSYLDLIAKLRAANPKVKIYACLPVPVFPENFGIRETVMLGAIQPLIRKAAAQARVSLLDLHTPLLGKERCFADRVHPNEEGTLRIAGAVYQGLTGKAPPPVFKPAAGLTILPLGDSITMGAGDSTKDGTAAGYRDRLFALLTEAKVRFQFLGSMMNQSSVTIRAAGQDFHEGHGSYSLADILANLDGFKPGPHNTSNGGHWLSGGPSTDRPAIFPDVVTLMGGTNDIQAKAPLEEMQRRMTAILDWFKANRPKSRVFVGTIVPYDNATKKTDDYNGKVKAFNAWLAATLPAKYPGNFHLVDLYSLFFDSAGQLKPKSSPDGIYLADGVHPTHNAYVAMGEAWFNAIRSSYAKTPQ